MRKRAQVGGERLRAIGCISNTLRRKGRGKRGLVIGRASRADHHPVSNGVFGSLLQPLDSAGKVESRAIAVTEEGFSPPSVPARLRNRPRSVFQLRNASEGNVIHRRFGFQTLAKQRRRLVVIRPPGRQVGGAEREQEPDEEKGSDAEIGVIVLPTCRAGSRQWRRQFCCNLRQAYSYPAAGTHDCGCFFLLWGNFCAREM